MKRLTLLLILLISINITAQELKYNSHVCNAVEYKNTIDFKSETLYLNLGTSREYLIALKSQKDREDLILFLKEGWGQYKEWAATAKANGVKDYTKAIGERTYMVVFQAAGNAYHSNMAKIHTVFMVDADGSTKLALYGAQTTSVKNKYITSHTGIVLMKNEDDLNSLISVLKQETMDEFYAKQNNTEELFTKN